jgi:hypothetical protein
MSVQLKVLRGGKDFEDIEIMAPDYDMEYVWLWPANDTDGRIDLSKAQLRELRGFINDLLGEPR